MIKFFRKIRQRLLTENPPLNSQIRAGRMSKYLLYAIGEIVLVVIGILIALQINNWNEGNKTARIESVYLSNILRDLHDQSTSIDIQMTKEKEYYESAGLILEGFHGPDALTLDSTFYARGTRLISRKTFLITDPTFTDLISSGNINVIRSNDYKDKLIKYYQELERIEKIIQSNNTLLIDQQYVPVFNKIGYFYAPTFKGYRSNITDLDESDSNFRFEPELLETSTKLMLTEENKLAFFNVLVLRHHIAMAHYSYMDEMKKVTEALIQELEDSNED